MTLLNILTPLYLLISLGFLLKKYNFPNEEFWPGIERMTYYVLFPTLIFVALIKAPVDLSLLGKILIIILIPVLVSGLLQWLGFFLPNVDKPTFSSMFQGAVRNNTPIALVISAWLVPDKGLAIVAVIILVSLPFNNLVSIFILVRYGKTNEINSSLWWKGVVGNPFIIACALGLVFNLFEIKLPKPLIDTADFLGRSALPFALLAVGAGLTFNSLFNNKLAILLSSASKLIVIPILCWGLCKLLDIETDLARIAIIFSAVPTAISSYILAKQMGGNSEGMAQIITFQILLAAITLPIFLLLAQRYSN